MKYFLLFLVSTALPLLAEEPTFSGEALKIKGRMDTLFEASKLVNADGATKAKARGQIEEAMDWDQIATLALGKANAKKYGGQKFADFKSLLKDVVLKTAFSRMDKFWEDGTVAKFKTIDVKGNDAHVAASFNVKDESFALDYYLLKKGANWLVYDIAYEEMKYSTNINEQIDSFLREKPFSELLGKLKKRREELDNPKPKKAG